jgi:tRNA-dihydrouridine synthase
MNFWNEITDPIFALAPMEEVTDTVFREVVMSVSNARILNVLFTEFTSIDGLLDERGFEKVSQRLIASPTETNLRQKNNTKLVAQIWGNEPEKFFKATQLIEKMNCFDGIDINMGCPVKKVVKKNTCSALIQFPELALDIVKATQQATQLPVSVKTRIGFNSVVTESWVSTLLNAKPAAITLHGRTQKQQSDGLADWNEIGKAISLRDELSPATKIIGNGDVESFSDGNEKIKTHKLDGVMVGRGIFASPWIFNSDSREITIDERKQLLLFHTQLFEKTWGNQKNFNELKRFYKIYINSFSGAGSLRAELMECKSYDEVYSVIS